MFRRIRNTTTNKIRNYPFTSFILSLLLLVGLIAITQKLQTPQKPPEIKTLPKKVTVYQPEQGAFITASGKVTQEGDITIVAQTAGIIKNIRAKTGSKINPGNVIADISATYASGNPTDISAKIAQTNLTFLENNLNLQKETIRVQRELANTQDTSSDELRDINSKSIDDSKNIIDQSQSLLDSVNDQLKQLEENNTNGSNNQAISQAKQSKVALSSSLTQLRSTLRTLEYQTSSEQEPASLANLGRELTNRGLDLQEKTLELNLQTAKLNTQLAAITQSFSYPTTPCAGTIEYIYVHPGQQVTPGTPIALIKADKSLTTISIDLDPQQISSIDINKPATITDTQNTLTYLSHTTSAVSGSLGRITYTTSDKNVTNNQYLSIKIPQQVTTQILIPIDAIYQSPEKSYVFLLKENIATSQEVTLGQVQGAYINILSGITLQDQIITSRSVNSGDAVTTN